MVYASREVSGKLCFTVEKLEHGPINLHDVWGWEGLTRLPIKTSKEIPEFRSYSNIIRNELYEYYNQFYPGLRSSLVSLHSPFLEFRSLSAMPTYCQENPRTNFMLVRIGGNSYHEGLYALGSRLHLEKLALR